jgi:tRNA (cytidine32/uridine32-2'-O)-methyltransferase
MKNRRKSGAYTTVCEHFEEIFHSRSAKNESFLINKAIAYKGLMSFMLDNITFILNHTSHPGNIGSAARALKTMGLKKLILVKPKHFPSPEAVALAAGADDILEQALVVDSFEQAIAPFQLIIGTSARTRSLPWPLLNPAEVAEKMLSESNNQQTALIFGREDIGLRNEELQRCHFHAQIPANPEYCSLNIAAAVQIFAYEIRAALVDKNIIQSDNSNNFSTAKQTELFYRHLNDVLRKIEFIKPAQPNRIMERLQRLFQRTRLEKAELDILRGILTEIEKRC